MRRFFVIFPSLFPCDRIFHPIRRYVNQSRRLVYKQRTATERINSQAKELGIERPKLHNRQAIANLNTLIYVLISLRTLQRIRQRKSEPPAQDTSRA